jgi:catechol 2,3-dioxygenase-like lactoylglutathione lyase family enzyme
MSSDDVCSSRTFVSCKLQLLLIVSISHSRHLRLHWFDDYYLMLCASLTWWGKSTRLIRQFAASTIIMYTMDEGDNMSSGRHYFNIGPATRIGYVSLNVSHLERSLKFYEKVLGFKKVSRTSTERALLSANGSPSYLVELLQADAAAGYKASTSETRRAGLYHFAVLLPERKYLADMLQNLSKRRGEIRFDGLADHQVSESIYIRDPDNIGIEIYCDRPSLQWEWREPGQDGDRQVGHRRPAKRIEYLRVESDAC